MSHYAEHRKAVSEEYAQAGSPETTVAPIGSDKGTKKTNKPKYPPSWVNTFAWPEGATSWALFLTLFVIAWQSVETHAAAEAGLIAADAAKTSTEIAIGVSIPTLVVHELGAGVVGAANVEAFFQFPMVKITIKNYGKTPAFLKWWTLCFTCEDLPDVPIYAGPGDGMILDKIVVLPDGTYTLPILSFPQRKEFSLEDAKAIVNREKTFRVYGYICYGDIFGNPLRRLKFCETVLNIYGGNSICDWWEGLAPPAYTGIEQFPTNKPIRQGHLNPK